MRQSNIPFSCLHRQNQVGFTLLEIMISLTILASIAGIFLTIFSDGMLRVSEGESSAKAMIYAQSKMDEILLVQGKDLKNIDTSGEFASTHFSYRIEMKPQQFDGEPRKVSLQHIGLTVFWDDGDGERSVFLEALKWVPNENAQ